MDGKGLSSQQGQMNSTDLGMSGPAGSASSHHLPMLNSWFGSKGNDDKTKDARRSTDLERIFTNPSELQDDTSKPTRRTPPIGFTSPHDAVLAKMRGLPPVKKTDDGLLRDDNHTMHDDSVSGPSPTAGSYSTTTNIPSGPKQFLHDPYDGTPLGLLMTPPSELHFQRQESSPRHLGIPPTGNKEEQWTHLSRVLDLQNEIAKMHLKMEGVGSSDGKGKGAGKGRGRGKGKGMGQTRASNDRERPTRSATTDTIYAYGHDGDEEGVDDAGNEENEIKKAREEQFSNLADQFEGRKESIQEIMGKMNDLSKALTDFHTLQAPTFEFSKPGSRQDSVTPDRTPPVIQKLSPPQASATLPNPGLTNLPNTQLLRPVLPSVQSSGGSLSSATAYPSERESNIIPASLSRSLEPRSKAKDPLTSLIVNSLEPGKQSHLMDSPDSMRGNLKLPTED